MWDRFNVRWNAVLERHGVPYLHATDLTNFKRIYIDWDEERRRSLAADLIDVIHSCGRIAAVGAVLSIDDYRSLTEEQQTTLRDPFFPLFQEVVRGTALEALFQPSDVKVKMVFSQQDEFGPRAQQLWNLMRQTVDIRKRFDVLEFANMRSVPGLQAADLLAFELRRYYQNKVSRPDLDVRWALRQILWQQRAYGTRYIKFFPKWYLRLQLMPWWIFYPVMTLVTVLIAIPSYFEPSAFALVMRDPQLSDAEEKRFRRLVRKERIERLGRWARKLVSGHARSE